jgi:hypothetical protein
MPAVGQALGRKIVGTDRPCSQSRYKIFRQVGISGSGDLYGEIKQEHGWE